MTLAPAFKQMFRDFATDPEPVFRGWLHRELDHAPAVPSYRQIPGAPVNGPWVAFPFAATWANLNAPNACAYRLDANGVVHLRGAASPASGYTYGGAHATIGTLPAGYRPAQSANRVVIGHNNGDSLEHPRWLNISTAGVVAIQSALGGLDDGSAGNWWTLDCSFFAS